jgi:hypothetical protein
MSQASESTRYPNDHEAIRRLAAAYDVEVLGL